jgi:hypothetical protein
MPFGDFWVNELLGRVPERLGSEKGSASEVQYGKRNHSVLALPPVLGVPTFSNSDFNNRHSGVLQVKICWPRGR